MSAQPSDALASPVATCNTSNLNSSSILQYSLANNDGPEQVFLTTKVILAHSSFYLYHEIVFALTYI